MARKPHPSSVLKTLPDSDQEALFEFLKTHTLAEGVQWLVSNNDVRTNDSSLSDWRAWYDMTRTITGWSGEVEEVKRLLAGTGTDPELIPKIGEAIFISRAAKTGDAKMFTSVAAVIQRHNELKSGQKHHADKMEVSARQLDQKDKAIRQKDKQIEMQRRKLELHEKRERETKEDLQNPTLTEEQRAARMRARFGV